MTTFGVTEKRATLILVSASLVSALVWSMAGSARAQCCGDCNGDGAVTINELITAVNNALSGCGAATATLERTVTPTRTPTLTHKPTVTPTPVPHCAFTFTDTNGNGACVFQGTYNRGCGSALNSTFLSTGTLLTVEIATMDNPQAFVFFRAMVDSSTSASLEAWSTDGFQTSNHPIAGVIQLNDNGSQLVVFPNDPPFMIQGCNFVQYLGTYIGSSRAVAERAPLSLDAEHGAALDRLRAWLARPIPNLGAP